MVAENNIKKIGAYIYAGMNGYPNPVLLYGMVGRLSVAGKNGDGPSQRWLSKK